ncbi:hypothetical protein [Halioxenophilus sp. WMMB6]|uniref:CAF17-like 4Fe-4S cluster assembly/insertion protein YgfZ n=1 Tax=Halioxenophilus sp. WMMB6 TaxID=3073815 RepID=UPI00295ED8E1|nr:hypothetical protein [Halioxenophilus sp. WMMB6]
MNQLDGHAALNGCQCNPKGRIIFNFLANAPEAETIQLRLPTEMVEIARKSLGKYIVFSKAEFTDAYSPIIGIEGEQAESLVTTVFGQAPSKDLAISTSKVGTVIRLSTTRFECWLNAETASQTWLRLSELAPVAATDQWQLADIRDGIANVFAPTTEEFIPQTLNYGQLNAISFTKGCYTGQEVVARMQYLGKQKRHTYRGSTKAADLPLPGANLYVQGSQQAAGKVACAAASTNDELELLMCLSDSAFAQGAVYLDPEYQTPVHFLELPYDLAESTK